MPQEIIHLFQNLKLDTTFSSVRLVEMFKISVSATVFATGWSAIKTKNTRVINRGVVEELLCSNQRKARPITSI